MDGEAGTVLEAGSPLGASMLWGLQRAYYERAGPQAWRPGGIPFHITTSPTMAQCYAQLIRAFATDRAAAGEDAAAPIHVVELGGGAGRFTFRLLRRMRGLNVRYVLTDVVEANIEHARANARLAPFVDAGLLDVALFDGARPGPLELRVSGETLDGPLPGPIVVIANYVFDCIPHDAYSVVDGELLETLLTILAPSADLDLGAPGGFEQLRMRWGQRPFDPAAVADPAVLAVLEHYRAALPHAGVMIPTAALNCLAHLSAMAPAGLLALVSDRGRVSEQAIVEQADSGLALHEQSFSLPVNFDAMARWVALQEGGAALMTPQRPSRLVTAAFGLGGGPLPETARVFEREVSLRGPDELYTVQTVLMKNARELTLEQILSIMRLLEFDADALSLLVPALVDRVPSEPKHLHAELHQVVALAWEDFYPSGDEAVIASRLAIVLACLGATADAQALLAIVAGAAGA